MKVDAKEQYNAVRDQIIENVGKEKFETLLERKAKEYGVDASTEQGRVVVDDEVIAQLCEDMLSDTSKLESFAERHLEAAKALKERLVKILNAIKEALKGVGDYTSDLIADQKTVDKWLNGLDAVLAKVQERQDAAKMQQSEQAEQKATETGYAIDSVDGVEFVRAEPDLFMNEDGSIKSESEIFNSLVGKVFHFPDGDVEIVKNLPGKNMKNELIRRSPKQVKQVKNVSALNTNANRNMEELMGRSTLNGVAVPDVNNRHEK